MRSTPPAPQPASSWITQAVRLRESELADACATAATQVRDTLVAGKLAGLVFEHLRHARPHLECAASAAGPVDSAVLRGRARRPHALSDRCFDAAVDRAVAGAIARAHAELALFIEDACGSLLVAPVERERLLRVAYCTATMGEGLE